MPSILSILLLTLRRGNATGHITRRMNSVVSVVAQARIVKLLCDRQKFTQTADAEWLAPNQPSNI